jgi:hypothetical protein
VQLLGLKWQSRMNSNRRCARDVHEKLRCNYRAGVVNVYGPRIKIMGSEAKLESEQERVAGFNPNHVSASSPSRPANNQRSMMVITPTDEEPKMCPDFLSLRASRARACSSFFAQVFIFGLVRASLRLFIEPRKYFNDCDKCRNS